MDEMKGKRCLGDDGVSRIPLVAAVDRQGGPVPLDGDGAIVLNHLVQAVTMLTHFMVSEQKTQVWKDAIGYLIGNAFANDPHSLCPLMEILSRAHELVSGGQVAIEDGKFEFVPPPIDQFCGMEDCEEDGKFDIEIDPALYGKEGLLDDGEEQDHEDDRGNGMDHHTGP